MRKTALKSALKYIVLGCAAAGLVGALLLPMVTIGPLSLRAIDDPNGAAVAKLLLGFIVPLALAAIAVYRRSLDRWAAIVSAIAFLLAGFAIVPEGGGRPTQALEGAGYDVMLFSAFIGMAAAVVAAIFPDRKRRSTYDPRF